MAITGDKLPMITAQYKFANHPGWQGVGHCSLLRDSNTYYLVSQGRLSSNKNLLDLHVRRMVWTPSGWPVVSHLRGMQPFPRIQSMPQNLSVNGNILIWNIR